MEKNTLLTSAEALAVMHRFLEMYWERGASEEIAILLGALSIQPDGRCADPALWNDWVQCIQEVADRGKRESMGSP